MYLVPDNHHTFNERIGYAPMDLVLEQVTERIARSTTRPPPPRAAEKTARNPKMSKNSLHPMEGAFKIRLVQTIEHLPVTPPPKANDHHICQLHRFAHNTVYKDNSIPSGARSNVLYCTGCKVNLCLNCFYLFHKTEEVADKIGKILQLCALRKSINM